MNTPQPLDLSIGATLPPLSTGPITRHRVALYAHGSGDLNPIHVDPDYARQQAGLPDVIVHGMYSMGQLSRLLTRWAGPDSVRSIETRFAAMLPVMASLECNGVVEAMQPVDGGSLVTVKLVATQGDGMAVATGSAQVFVAAGR
ncbi:MAG: dehydratase [Chitinophagaceae bacterium]|nr:dehydratase [Rubrivivax sp.]